MQLRYFAGCLLAIVWIAGTAAAQQPTQFAFHGAGDLSAWKTTGDVSIDTTKGRSGEGGAPGAGGALKIAAGGKAILPLRPTDGAGRVEMWVDDDLTQSPKPKQSSAGPRWGLIQADGHMLVIGVLYSPYLAGDTTYATSDTDGTAPLESVQYSALQRVAGWHKWTFDFDDTKGLTITLDDKKKARFDWNDSKISGFSGVALLGDGGESGLQTLWVADLSVTLGGAMKTEPTPPPPATPETDPAPEKKVELLAAVRGQHPRLLFTAADIPALKQSAQGAGKPFYDQLLKYLPACVPPKDTKYLTDATDGQRQGMWRAPTVGLHYVLTGDKKSLETGIGFLKAFLAQDHWETGSEQDSGMSSANIMVGAALLYDWLYNDLDPAFRQQVAKKLLLMARREYYNGHLMKMGSGGAHYWQQDPQNNHRWHRDAGLTLAVLAVAGDEPSADWIVGKTLDELNFLSKWLPEDGTSHESPTYMVFGAPYLLLAFDAADRCLGTDFLHTPFIKNTAMYRVQTIVPGLKDCFHYGDDGGGLGMFNNYNFLATANGEADLQAALLDAYHDDPNTFMYGWQSLVAFNPAVSGGSINNLPKRYFFPDLGMGIIRDGWGAQNVGMMFKCCPYGGLRLNEYRNANDYHYVNVAHDDPDANMFLLYGNGGYIADGTRYAYNKVTSSLNTILVDGKGQKNEGGKYTQPLKSTGADADMTKMAWTTAWRDTGPVAAIEGEAHGAYVGLDRYRRTVLWVEGSYVLILDDIIPTKQSQITWLMQDKQAAITDAAAGKFLMAGTCDMTVVSDGAYTASVGVSTADQRGTVLGYQQIRLDATTSRWRLATVFDPWKTSPKLTMTKEGDGMRIRVQAANGSDTWNWSPPADEKSPSQLTGQRSGGFSFELK